MKKLGKSLKKFKTLGQNNINISPIERVINDYILRNPHFTSGTITTVTAKLNEVLDPTYIMPDASTNYYDTYINPDIGLSKTTSEWIYLWKMTITTTQKTNTTSSGTLKWQMGNSIYNQNNTPAHTFVSGQDWVILTSLDSFTGLTQFNIASSGYTGECPYFTFNTSLNYLYINGNSFTGNMTLYKDYMKNWTTLYQFIIDHNQFTGDLSSWSELSTMTSPYRFFIHNNNFTGDLSSWSSLSTWTYMLRFNISNNQFTGNINSWSAWSTWVDLDQFFIGTNNFTGDFSGLNTSSMIGVSTFNALTNSLTGGPSFTCTTLTTINYGTNAMTLTNVNNLFLNLDTYYSLVTPVRNVTVTINGGTNASPTGGVLNTNIVNLKANFITAGFVFTVLIN